MSAAGYGGTTVYGNTPDGTDKSDVNKCREQIAAMAEASVAFHRDSASSGGADAAAARESVAPSLAARVEYRTDEQSTRNLMLHGEFQIAKVKCVKCGGHTDIPRSRPHADAEWSPDVDKSLFLFGWLSDGVNWYCGQHCSASYAAMMRNSNKVPPPVVSLKDASYARRLYASQKADAASVEDVTTPAAPPVLAQPAPAATAVQAPSAQAQPAHANHIDNSRRGRGR